MIKTEESTPRVDRHTQITLNTVAIDNVAMPDALSIITDAVVHGKELAVYFVNADCINISASNPEYLHVLKSANTLVLADGIGIRIAGKLSGQPIVDNVNGTDLFPLLCQRSIALGQSIYLLGAAPEVAAEVEAKMVALYPGLRIAGTHHGFFPHDNCNHVIRKINASGADILLVAFGAPRQEQWIYDYSDQLTPRVRIGVGGLFDFFSGRMRRAPMWMRKLSVEWVWRLCMEPRRMWRRYLVGNFIFLARIIWWQVKKHR